MKIIPERAERRCSNLGGGGADFPVHELFVPIIFSLLSPRTVLKIGLITLIRDMVGCVLCGRKGDSKAAFSFTASSLFFSSFPPTYFTLSLSPLWPGQRRPSQTLHQESGVKARVANRWRQRVEVEVEQYVIKSYGTHDTHPAVGGMMKCGTFDGMDQDLYIAGGEAIPFVPRENKTHRPSVS